MAVLGVAIDDAAELVRKLDLQSLAAVRTGDSFVQQIQEERDAAWRQYQIAADKQRHLDMVNLTKAIHAGSIRR